MRQNSTIRPFNSNLGITWSLSCSGLSRLSYMPRCQTDIDLMLREKHMGELRPEIRNLLASAGSMVQLQQRSSRRNGHHEGQL